MRKLAIAPLALAACSFAFARGPHDSHSCPTTAPILDTAGALGALAVAAYYLHDLDTTHGNGFDADATSMAVIPAVIYAASAAFGWAERERCRAARRPPS